MTKTQGSGLLPPDPHPDEEQDWLDEQERIADDDPIWAERDAIMFPDKDELCTVCGENPITLEGHNGLCAVCVHTFEPFPFPTIENITVNDGAPYMAGAGWRYSEWPRTASFFADQITESASAMRPVPTLCLAVCPTHHWSCAVELPHGNGAHVCNSGQPHHFFTRK